MFTGLVTAVGTVRKATPIQDGLALRIGARYAGVRRGESIAVDGACLTVTRTGKGWFELNVVGPTLGRTLFGEYAPGRRVNLERALRVGDRLGGHLVQGHVDGVARVEAVTRRNDAWLVDVAIPADVSRVTVPLGSITLDGVSLTVNRIPGPGLVQVSLIPVTIKATTLGDRRPGDRVHVEADAIGKYVEQFVRERSDRP